jgi:hypothetical protein
MVANERYTIKARKARHIVRPCGISYVHRRLRPKFEAYFGRLKSSSVMKTSFNLHIFNPSGREPHLVSVLSSMLL